MYRKTPLSMEVRRVLKLLMGTLFGLLVVVSGYFFIKMSNTAELGYVFKENQVKQKQLESENRILKQQVLQLQSINAIEGSDSIKDMQLPQAETYVEPVKPISRK